MLTPHELRVGNWIATYDPRKGKDKKEFPVQVTWRHLRAQEVEHKDNFKPIPLTDAILIAGGWNQKEHTDEYIHPQLRENLTLSKDGEGFVFKTLPNRLPISEPLTYVHELQNAFYSLFKQEWKLDPNGIAELSTV